MMTGSKVSLTIDHSYILTTDHYDMGIKIKDIQKQVKLKKSTPNQLPFPKYELSKVRIFTIISIRVLVL